MINEARKSQIESAVIQILYITLKLPTSSVGVDANMENTPAWDSLRHIEIMFAVEEELSVQFSETELGELHSVQKIVDAVYLRHAA